MSVLESTQQYASETGADHFAWWCEHYLRHSVDRFAGDPVVWEPWQMDWWRELLAFGEDDAPYWRSAALLVPRKNGKTLMLAALALYDLIEGDGKPEILLAAASDKQAGRLFDGCIDFLRQNPELNQMVHRREHIGEIVNPVTGGKIIRLSSTGESLDGFNPSRVIADELHAWLTPTRRRVWTSLRTAGGARKFFQIVTISTAGDAANRAWSILGKMLDGNEANGEIERPHEGLVISRNHRGRLIIYNYSAQLNGKALKDPSDYATMKIANPASWVDEDFIREQAETDDLEDHEVLQLHGNVWAETSTTYIPSEALAEAMKEFKPLERREKVVLGFDGSEFHDETWLVAVGLDGRIQPLERWQKPPRSEDWRVPRPEVHRAIAAAFERFQVVELAADPPGWYSEIDEWTQLYGDRVVMFDTNQPKRFAPACERLRTDIKEGHAKFGGELASELRVHFGNCVTKETSSGTVITKDDKNSPRKVDGVAASAIAYDRAMWHADNMPPEYKVAGFR
jgi:phage terminase large subunit-like protein